MNQQQTITEFLTTRLDEDEQQAISASPGPWHLNDEHDEVIAVDDVEVCTAFALSSNQQRNTARHIARHDPARVLHEVAAKRAMLKAHRPEWPSVEWNHDQDGKGNAWVCQSCGNHNIDEWQGWSPEIGEAWMPEGMNPPYTVWPCRTVKLLAAVYPDHPDYRKEWRP